MVYTVGLEPAAARHGSSTLPTGIRPYGGMVYTVGLKPTAFYGLKVRILLGL